MALTVLLSQGNPREGKHKNTNYVTKKGIFRFLTMKQPCHFTSECRHGLRRPARPHLDAVERHVPSHQTWTEICRGLTTSTVRWKEYVIRPDTLNIIRIHPGKTYSGDFN